MSNIVKGRNLTDIKPPFVVLMVGIRVNRWWAIHKWFIVVFRFVQAIIDTEKNNPDLLACRYLFNWRQIVCVQYWRSAEAISAFTSKPEGLHIKVWRYYNLSVSDSGAVGIWHETFFINDDSSECVYTNMPILGLASKGQSE